MAGFLIVAILIWAMLWTHRVVFCSSVATGHLLPGAFWASRILDSLGYRSSSTIQGSVFGIPLGSVCDYIYLFVFIWAIWTAVWRQISDRLALALTGGVSRGPAEGSIVGSALNGEIGSAVANVVRQAQCNHPFK